MKHARPMPSEYVIVGSPLEGAELEALLDGMTTTRIEQPVTGPEEQPHSRPEEAPTKPAERLEQPTRGPRETT